MNRMIKGSRFYLFILFISIWTGGFYIADAAKELKTAEVKKGNEGEDSKKELDEIKKRLEVEREKQAQLSEKEQDILKALEEVDKSLKEKSERLGGFENELTLKSTEEELIQGDLTAILEQISKRKRMLMERMEAIYKGSRYSYFELVMEPDDIYDAARRQEYLRIITNKDKEIINSGKELLRKLSEKKNILVKKKEELAYIKDNLYKEIVAIEEDGRKKSELMASVLSDRNAYEESIKALEEQALALKEIIKRSEEDELKRKEEGNGNRFKGLEAEKGRLEWPNLGMVVSQFGKQKHPRFGTEINKTGIEISSFKGDTARAVYEGSVIYADWFRGYGLLVIIDHGEKYYSLYGHLLSKNVAVGDSVEKGDTVGEIGDSGLSLSNNLYFELRHKGLPLDPLVWLKKKKSNVKQK